MSEKQVEIKVGEPTQIEFYGDNLTAVFDGETVWVAVKPIIENLGLAWQPQHRKILDDPVLSQVITEKVMTSHGRDGKTYKTQMLCLPLEYLNGFLFKINPNKIPNPQVREKVIRYQKECYKALYEYFVADKVRRAYSFEEFVKWAELEIKTMKEKSKAMEKAARLINAVVRATKDTVLRDKLTREVLKQFGYEKVVKEAEKTSFLCLEEDELEGVSEVAVWIRDIRSPHKLIPMRTGIIPNYQKIVKVEIISSR